MTVLPPGCVACPPWNYDRSQLCLASRTTGSLVERQKLSLLRTAATCRLSRTAGARALPNPRKQQAVLRIRQSRCPSPSCPNPRKKIPLRERPARATAATRARVDQIPDPGVATRIPIPSPPLRAYPIRCCRFALGVAAVVFLLMVCVAVPVGEMKRHEGDGGDAAGEQKHRVEPPLVEAEPVAFKSTTKQNQNTVLSIGAFLPKHRRTKRRRASTDSKTLVG